MVKGTLFGARGFQGVANGREDVVNVRQPAHPDLAAREASFDRADEDAPARAKRAEVGLHGRLAVHAVVHRRGDEEKKRSKGALVMAKKGSRFVRVGERLRQLERTYAPGGNGKDFRHIISVIPVLRKWAEAGPRASPEKDRSRSWDVG